MSEIKLSEIFQNEGIKDFGSALRETLREKGDYASLVEIEYVETPKEFVEVLKNFLRRYESYVKRYKRKRIEETSLDEVIKLVDKYGVRSVRAAWIAHALVESSRPEEVDEMEGDE